MSDLIKLYNERAKLVHKKLLFYSLCRPRTVLNKVRIKIYLIESYFGNLDMVSHLAKKIKISFKNLITDLSSSRLFGLISQIENENEMKIERKKYFIIQKKYLELVKCITCIIDTFRRYKMNRRLAIIFSLQNKLPNDIIISIINIYKYKN